MNTVRLMGRLTEDPVCRQTSSDVSVCSFCIAVSRPHTKDKTDFIDCTAWRNTAEFLEKYFHKGKMIAVTGCLTSEVYEDNEGKKRKSQKVLVNSVDFCGDKEKNDSVPENTDFHPVADEDLPFN